MPYAVVLNVRDEDAPRIVTCWNLLAEKDAAGQVKFSEDQRNSGFTPHITAAVLDDAAKPETLIATLAPMAAAWKSIPVEYDSLVVLPRNPPPILARPVVTQELLDVNKKICGAMPDQINAYSKPGIWQPHTTMARDVPAEKTGMALTALLEVWKPFKSMLDSVSLMHTRTEGKTWHIKHLWHAKLEA